MSEQSSAPITPDFVADLERREAELASKPIRYVRPDGTAAEFVLTADQHAWVNSIIRTRLNRANATFQRRLQAVIMQLEELAERKLN